MKDAISSESQIHYDYVTILITKSRIERGLLAIPQSFASEFLPDENSEISVQLDDSSTVGKHNYTSFTSRTREARIGGLANWFSERQIREGNEIVVQILDREKQIYRLSIEKHFVEKIEQTQRSLDLSEDENSVNDKITELVDYLSIPEKAIAVSELNRIAKTEPLEIRQKVDQSSRKVRERVPNRIRVLLEKVYRGHCQVCDFSFLKKDLKPYYELHHIKPNFGHHPKNLLVVCANCHRQFTFASVTHFFDQNNWLENVRFNDREYRLNQILSSPELSIVNKLTFI